jgi:hypothetical protein
VSAFFFGEEIMGTYTKAVLMKIDECINRLPYPTMVLILACSMAFFLTTFMMFHVSVIYDKTKENQALIFELQKHIELSGDEFDKRIKRLSNIQQISDKNRQAFEVEAKTHYSKMKEMMMDADVNRKDDNKKHLALHNKIDDFLTKNENMNAVMRNHMIFSTFCQECH